MKGFLAGVAVAFVIDLPPMDRAGVIVITGVITMLAWFVGRARQQARWPHGKP